MTSPSPILSTHSTVTSISKTFETPDLAPITRAIISVSDKDGLEEFARSLADFGIEIYSTGGTRKFLLEKGIEAIDIASYTSFPEVMDGRVKTLHPKIFGGILARRTLDADQTALRDHGILTFDLVVVNLYPFQATIEKPGVSFPEAVEQIDIGGPSLIRAAAKNHVFTTVATSPSQYGSILEELKTHRGTTMKLRRRLAAECFAETARYDASIAEYMLEQSMSGQKDSPISFPTNLTLPMHIVSSLRYGENPHQPAALYRLPRKQVGSLVDAVQRNGKELSYNNLLDLDAALSMVRCFAKPSVVVIKHNNPCGAASAHKASFACRKALDGDPLSAFGGVLGFNCVVDEEAAEVLCYPGLFIEAIVAPKFTDEALSLLRTKPKWRENVRLMETGMWGSQVRERTYKVISGGVLVQEADNQPPTNLNWKTVTDAHVADELWDDIAFGWEMVRHVKSNAIVLARDAALVGVGAGQMSRVDSVEIAIEKAGDRSHGSILASDAFFPFPDSIHRAAKAGVVAIIQPGGSKKDDEAIAACNEYRIPMIFTSQRHFKH